jgi:hypothetical protein
MSARQHDKTYGDQHPSLQSLDEILEPGDTKQEKSQTLDEADLAKFLAKKSMKCHARSMT